MRVLIACESSGQVRRAFRALGHDAYSCDLLPSSDGSIHHFRADALEVMRLSHWDMMIAHPPCTHLAGSGAWCFPAKRADGRQREAIDFFLALASAPIKRIGIENPVGIMSTIWRRPDQIIQPHQFGQPEFKATCLWLKNLPLLQATCQLKKPERDTDEWKAWNYTLSLSPSVDRWKKRSETKPGIAMAMAQQWANATIEQFELF